MTRVTPRVPHASRRKIACLQFLHATAPPRLRRTSAANPSRRPAVPLDKERRPLESSAGPAESSELIRQVIFFRKFLEAADRLPPDSGG